MYFWLNYFFKTRSWHQDNEVRHTVFKFQSSWNIFTRNVNYMTTEEIWDWFLSHECIMAVHHILIRTSRGNKLMICVLHSLSSFGLEFGGSGCAEGCSNTRSNKAQLLLITDERKQHRHSSRQRSSMLSKK